MQTSRPSLLPSLFTLIRVQAALVMGLWISAAWPQAVTTQHYDNNRTGTNLAESVLTVSNVASGQFASASNGSDSMGRLPML